MLLPNKIYTYNQSVIPKMVIILKEIKKAPYDVGALYSTLNSEFDDIAQFIGALDCLYALGKVEFDSSKRLYYVEIN